MEGEPAVSWQKAGYALIGEPNGHVSGLWLRGNPGMHRENMQLPCRNTLRRGSEAKTFLVAAPEVLQSVLQP